MPTIKMIYQRPTKNTFVYNGAGGAVLYLPAHMVGPNGSKPPEQIEVEVKLG